MKKKLAIFLTTCLLASNILACSGDVTITEEQEDLIAQYAAGVMLRYSYDNKWKYTKLYDAMYGYHPTTAQTSEATTSITSEETESFINGNQTNNSSTKTSSVSEKTTMASINDALPQALSLTGCQIKYSSFTVGDKYPLNAQTVYVPAESGRVIVGVEFVITNNSGAAVVANTNTSGVLMKLKISGTNYTNYVSLIKNSLLQLKNVTINPGESYTAVVLFQIPEELSSSVSGASLTATKDKTSIGTMTVN